MASYKLKTSTKIKHAARLLLVAGVVAAVVLNPAVALVVWGKISAVATYLIGTLPHWMQFLVHNGITFTVAAVVIATIFNRITGNQLKKTSTQIPGSESDSTSVQDEVEERILTRSDRPRVTTIGADNIEGKPEATLFRKEGEWGHSLYARRFIDGQPTDQIVVFHEEMVFRYLNMLGYKFGDDELQKLVDQQKRRLEIRYNKRGKEVRQIFALLSETFKATRQRDRVKKGNPNLIGNPQKNVYGFTTDTLDILIERTNFGDNKGYKVTYKLYPDGSNKQATTVEELQAKTGNSIEMNFKDRVIAENVALTFNSFFHQYARALNSGHLEGIEFNQSDFNNAITKVAQVLETYESKLTPEEARAYAPEQTADHTASTWNPPRALEVEPAKLEQFIGGAAKVAKFLARDHARNLIARAANWVFDFLPSEKNVTYDETRPRKNGFKTLVGLTSHKLDEYGNDINEVTDEGFEILKQMFESGELRPINLLQEPAIANLSGLEVVPYEFVKDPVSGGWSCPAAVEDYLHNMAVSPYAMRVRRDECAVGVRREAGFLVNMVDKGAQEGTDWVVQDKGRLEIMQFVADQLHDVVGAKLKEHVIACADPFFMQSAIRLKDGKKAALRVVSDDSGNRNIEVYDHSVVQHDIEGSSAGIAARNIKNKAIAFIKAARLKITEAKKRTAMRGAFVTIYAWDKDAGEYKILVIRRDWTANRYGLPGGHVDPGKKSEFSNPIEAALREMDEELGGIKNLLMKGGAPEDVAERIVESFKDRRLELIDTGFSSKATTEFHNFGLKLTEEEFGYFSRALAEYADTFNVKKDEFGLKGKDVRPLGECISKEAISAQFVSPKTLALCPGIEPEKIDEKAAFFATLPFQHGHERRLLEVFAQFTKPFNGMLSRRPEVIQLRARFEQRRAQRHDTGLSLLISRNARFKLAA